MGRDGSTTHTCTISSFISASETKPFFADSQARNGGFSTYKVLDVGNNVKQMTFWFYTNILPVLSCLWTTMSLFLHKVDPGE